MTNPDNDPGEFLTGLTRAWQDMMQQFSALAPWQGTDKRFQGDAWRTDARFDYLHQSYLACSDFMLRWMDATASDDKARRQIDFALRQAIDALSPANFFATNPEAIQLALKTNGKSLTDGVALFFQDMAKGRITISDEQAFEVGENVATSDGEVIFQNELIQLIQYAPSTPQVGSRPLLIIPPCINKFYILDLQPENSFVRYAVEQGNTVFMVSWRNITDELGHLGWDDYLDKGVVQAIDVVLAITGADQLNALGFCVGGTLLASAVAVMRQQGADKVASLTLLTTMLDFSDTGEIGVLVDEASVKQREQAIGATGVFKGKELAMTFSALRANDLIWPYVVNSYLKGKAPAAFDLLYWNADSTNLPGPMFTWYLRNTYLENKLREPGRTVQCGMAADLGAIDVPAYLYASRDDHIVPWRTAYASSHLLKGDTTFVLGASGHIAGVINSASKNKRNYWTDGPAGGQADAWLEAAQSVPGSWWPHWSAWLKPKAGELVAARKTLGNGQYRRIEPAPGSYVKQSAD
jgi:polyhydroxyalkanoate synthase